MDGISAYLLMKHEGEVTRVYHINEYGSGSWDVVEDGVISAPTFRMTDDLARELLDELMRYYQGASDMKSARADLLHERGRVDKLIEHIMIVQASDGETISNAVAALRDG